MPEHRVQIDQVRRAMADSDWGQAALLAEQASTRQALPRDLMIEIVKGCWESDRFASALPLCERLTRLDPYQPNYWFNLGLARRKLGDFEGAAEAQQAALDLAPDHKSAQIELGRIARDQERAQEVAAEAAEKERARMAAAAQAETQTAAGHDTRSSPQLPSAGHDSQAIPPDPHPVFPVAHSWMALGAIVLVLAVTMVVVAAVVLRARARERAYVEAAQVALGAIERLDDGLNVGYSYIEFGTRLADANHDLEKFRREYDQAPWTARVSYRSIVAAAEAYQDSLDVWKEKIDDRYDFHTDEYYESTMQMEWATASANIEMARVALRHGN